MKGWTEYVWPPSIPRRNMIVRASLRRGLVPSKSVYSLQQRWASGAGGPEHASHEAKRPEEPSEAGVARQHGFVDEQRKTVETAVGSLPLSPLMDPSFHAAKQRYKQPKKPPSPPHLKLKWQQHLARNPYGEQAVC